MPGKNKRNRGRSRSRSRERDKKSRIDRGGRSDSRDDSPIGRRRGRRRDFDRDDSSDSSSSRERRPRRDTERRGRRDVSRTPDRGFRGRERRREADRIEKDRSRERERQEQRESIIEGLSARKKAERESAYRQLSVEDNQDLILGFNNADVKSWLGSLTRSGLELALGDIENVLKENSTAFIGSLSDAQKKEVNVDRLTNDPPVAEYATLFSRRFDTISEDQKSFKRLAQIGSELVRAVQQIPNSSGVGSPGFTKDNVDKITVNKTAIQAADHIRDQILGDAGDGIRNRIKNPVSDQDYNDAKDDAGVLIAKIGFNTAHLLDGEIHAIGLGNDVLAASWVNGKRYARSYDDVVGGIDSITKWSQVQKANIISYYAGLEANLPIGVLAKDLKSVDGARLREFAAIQVAERGRELKRIEESGKPDKNIVKTALVKAGVNGFAITYAGRNMTKDAPFAQSGGQDALREVYKK